MDICQLYIFLVRHAYSSVVTCQPQGIKRGRTRAVTGPRRNPPKTFLIRQWPGQAQACVKAIPVTRRHPDLHHIGLLVNGRFLNEIINLRFSILCVMHLHACLYQFAPSFPSSSNSPQNPWPFFSSCPCSCSCSTQYALSLPINFTAPSFLCLLFPALLQLRHFCY